MPTTAMMIAWPTLLCTSSSSAISPPAPAICAIM